MQPSIADEDTKDADAPAAAAASSTTVEDGGGENDVPSSSPATAAARRRFRQEFHVLACRVSTSGEHVWSLVVENNGQVCVVGPLVCHAMQSLFGLLSFCGCLHRSVCISASSVGSRGTRTIVAEGEGEAAIENWKVWPYIYIITI